MPLNFPNIATLSIQQRPVLLNAGFNYSTAKTLEIRGLLIDLTNSFGVTGIWTGINTTNLAAVDYQPLLINGVNFGSGRIASISYDQGNDVRLKSYSAIIDVLDSGNLFNLTGTNYNGVDFSNSQFLEEFSENWSFQKTQNGGYSSNHSATIRFTTGVGNLNAIDAAKNLARTLFTGSNLGFVFYSGYANKQGKRFFSESYNAINKNCTFDETFNFDSDNGAYSATRNHAVSLSELGVILVSEKGQIRGIENINYQKALSALNGELTGAYYRSSGVASNYFATGAIILNSPLSQSRSFDLFNNNLSYEISFNNNPNNSGTYFWDYAQQVSRANGVGTIVENGTVLGRGANPVVGFSAAQNGFSTVKGSIYSRMSGAFITSFASGGNFLQSKSESYTPLASQITYAYQFSNDPSLIANSGIRKKEITVQNENVVHANNKLNIFNYKEISQDDKQATVGISTVNVNMQGDKTVALSNFLTLATSSINSRIPVGNDIYIGGASYSYNKDEGTLESNLAWVYNGYVANNTYPQ